MPKKAGPKLGNWKIKRQGDDTLLVQLPAGMKIIGDSIPVEDMLTAISLHAAIKKGRLVAKCCSGNMAIA